MKNITFNMKYFVIAAFIGLLSGPATAAVPHTCASGDIIKSSEMNANFDALDARITALENALAAHIADTANPHAVTAAQVGLGNVENIRVRFTATTKPTFNDDSSNNYSVGAIWVNTTTKQAYVLVDDTVGAAVWKDIARTYSIGDTGPAGGKVFYVYDSGKHGLEAAPVDQDAGTGALWGCSGTDIPGATGTAIGTGAQNTAAILAGCAETGAAAKLADAYTLNGYTDWFLPSKDELNLLYCQKGVVGGFASSLYWSSSQLDSSLAWSQNFNDGAQYSSLKASAARVRAVRAF